MHRGDELPADSSSIDKSARPHWLRTGYRFFPYAAQHDGQWWVLRFNHGFPEHDMYTLFVNGRPVADITGDPGRPAPLVASVGSLRPYDAEADEPVLEPSTAAAVVGSVARFVNYGSEHDDPCIFCSGDLDGMTRIQV
ncbi:hypothetical protein [Mycobacterium shimoidei]|uniref:hypothetical protein n=1 Tax=Mycobacterium shimoidei TaxID=29313 RepID=UPI00084836DC|nr:hypothetical protein [Mycobacterium shimoidei]MCV7258801.1 hypothetical protein [Mycobacterium shimoidei]ODR15298.1 hypothetical protein BHQ16_00690 [Mycobacterium shimoidei]ORW79877.1 hypothetical protein AWC26_13285 [Mycobacterium shimoidei]